MLGGSGVWELFVPDVGVGNIYKYEIRGADDVVRTKADPMARRPSARRTPGRSSTPRARVG
jgi:1,4-alpha-glucan branching enzyme